MKVGDKVRVVTRTEKGDIDVIHRGVLVSVTCCGGRVWDEKCPTDHPQHAEWFSFQSPRVWMVPV
jgi:hypothetical protein